MRLKNLCISQIFTAKELNAVSAPLNTHTHDRSGQSATECFAVIVDEVLTKGGYNNA